MGEGALMGKCPPPVVREQLLKLTEKIVLQSAETLKDLNLWEITNRSQMTEHDVSLIRFLLQS